MASHGLVTSCLSPPQAENGIKYSELSDVFAAFDLEDTGRIQVLLLSK
jgi:hypothetical protein